MRRKILIGIIFTGLILRFIGLNQSFWLDEAAQVIESERVFAQQIDLASDFHPPLYHLLLHFWLKIGNGEIFSRLPEVIMGVVSIFLVYEITRLLKFSNFSAQLTAFLLAVNPFHIYYSQEVRPYMLFSFLSLLATRFFLTGNLIALAIVVSLLVYTNYFAFFLLLAFPAASLLSGYKKDLNKVLQSFFLAFLIFLPWLPSLMRQLEIGFGNGLPGWKSVVSVSPYKAIPLILAKFIFGKASIDNNFIYALVLMPSVIAFAASGFLAFKSKKYPVLFMLFFVPLISALTVSFFLPVLAPQRMIFLLPFFLMIIAGSADIWKKWGIFLSLAVVITSLFGLMLYYLNARFQREDWRSSVQYLKEDSYSIKSLVAFAFPEAFAPFIWYNRGILESRGYAQDFRVGQSDIRRLSLDLSGRNTVYYYSYLDNLTDPKNWIQRKINENGFQLKSIRDFPGVGFVYKYEKD